MLKQILAILLLATALAHAGLESDFVDIDAELALLVWSDPQA